MDFNIEKIYKWIDVYPISRQKRNISRDFSDAVPLAEILKRHLPKAVDLHSYSPKNAVAQKIINWNMLNKKVLSKLGVNLNDETIEELAKSVPGVIERVLYQIKTKIEEKEECEKNTSEVYYVEGLTADVTGHVVPIKVKNGSKIIDQKIIPSEIYDSMKKEITEKDDELLALKNKIKHMEKLLTVKDERISDLTEQVRKISANGQSPRANGRVFSKLFKSD